MKKTFVFSIVILLLSVFITGCGADPQPTEPVSVVPETPVEQVQEEPVTTSEPKPNKTFGTPESYTVENDGVSFNITFWSGKLGRKGQAWFHADKTVFSAELPICRQGTINGLKK